MDNKGMQKFFFLMTVLSIISLGIVFLWEQIPIIKETAHAILDPTAGALISWNVTGGTLILFFIIALFMTIIQKFTVDQKTLREMKAEQKEISKELQQYRDNPEKALEVNKRSMKIMGDIMSMTMKSSFITMIPLILLFRWFSDVFTALGDPIFFGFINWFWLYLISVLVFGGILRKAFKMA
ncbi:MAG: EMC3/TMCO1 family protein [Candidatus Pacearchaeota archaeon]|jgi:uncharacterized membrane protein (DUF106 family)